MNASLHRQIPNPTSPSLGARCDTALPATAILLALAATGLPALAQDRPDEPSLPYTVQASDKLIRLSRDMLVSPQAWNDVAKYNRLKDPNVIAIGQKLDIPLRYLKSTAATGRIVSADGDVSIGGAPMQVGAAVSSGSQLRTGPNSSAVVELGDGSRVKLLPNSLAEVVTNKNYAMRDASASGSTTWFSGLMRLSSGTLEALASKNVKRATPLQVETPTSLVGVRGTEFRVGFDDPAGRNSRTEVVEGAVRADNTAQRSGADLPGGTGALVNPAEREVRVVQLLPAPDLSSVPAEVLKPQGSWQMPALQGAAAYRVQVSNDQSFDKIVRDLKVSSASADLGSLANGDWFARVRGIDAQGLEGFNAVKLIAVKDGQWRVSYSTLNVSSGNTVLTWQGLQANGQPLAATAYSAVVATDAALTQTVARAEGATPRLALGQLPAGIYYVRLNARTAQGEIGSETYRFELSRNWGVRVFDQTSALQAIR
ncbi:MAG: FecR domain-containing protein [Polaromonas sp.]|nr:FecR domain-containing protein [Polaromonas sp.]